MTFGGGTEICSPRRRAASPTPKPTSASSKPASASSPAAGAPRKCSARRRRRLPPSRPPTRKTPLAFAQSGEDADRLKRALETIAMAKVSTSAAEARALGLLAPSDRITLNRERLLLDAKAQAAVPRRSRAMPPRSRAPRSPPPASPPWPCLKPASSSWAKPALPPNTTRKSPAWAAYILSGGRLTAGSLVSEQYLLDLEREAFLSLCGERKTQERIAFTLKTGKPLRN